MINLIFLREYYGIPGGPVEYCAKHRPDNTVDIKHKRCAFPGCGLSCAFGFEGECASHCGTHKLDGMVNVKNKTCLFPGCKIFPSFGILGGKIEYCRRHKSPNMVNVKDKKCTVPGCMIRPCFGFEGRAMEYCNSHKQSGMVNIISKRCIYPECKVQARFGILGDRTLYCSEHKLTDMVNISDKRCDHDDCMTKSSFTPLFFTHKTHCRTHATLNEYSYARRHPICYELDCREPAVFIEQDNITVYPIRCRTHRLNTDVELINRICPNCEECIYYPENQDLCMECGRYRERIISSEREAIVEHTLHSNNVPFIYNKRVCHSGSRYRPDFLTPSTFGYIVVEVDENQHDKHFLLDEENRMITIYHDVQLISPGKQVLFLRYNPDKYQGPCIVDDKQRLEYLLTVIVSMKQLPSLGVALGYTKLFYDEFTGAPIVHSLDINRNIIDD